MERLLNSLIGAAFVLGGIILYDRMQYDDRVPIEAWLGTEALNSPVVGGDVLHVKVSRVKVRDDCPVASSRQALNENGKPYGLPSAVSIGGPIDDDTAEFSYSIPKDVPAGSYTLRVFLTYTCPEFVWTTQQPDTPFIIRRGAL